VGYGLFDFCFNLLQIQRLKPLAMVGLNYNFLCFFTIATVSTVGYELFDFCFKPSTNPTVETVGYGWIELKFFMFLRM